MGEQTGISWTDHTFNPWWGCAKVSPACQHCYAETFSKRVGQQVWGVDANRRFFGNKHWAEPLKWNAVAKREGVRRRVFCASMADVFEERDDLRAERQRLINTIVATSELDWLLLTKRPGNIAAMLTDDWGAIPNVWLGTTAENQEYADDRISALMRVPAAIHFVSYEPALGPLTLRDWKIDWLIAGGESGVSARSPEISWFRDVRDECAFRGIAFHFKQWGGLKPKTNGRILDGREWIDFPISALAANEKTA